MVSKKTLAIEEAKAYIRSAKANLDRGDENQCIDSLFYAYEHIANVLVVRQFGKPTKDHREKLNALGRAYREGRISSEEHEACKRVGSLRNFAQQSPYDDVAVIRLKKGEVGRLYESIVKLVDRIEKDKEDE
ncbi:MAG: hypothetical protein CVT63_03390 [Candidatus Anoxymicrobium japonicum]|uniref:HEPN domain-containing protein n=1 Tax=Candidatus Anoxymicrobium japonicum TaxID=2013648 RepID=A0A2N3G6J2_9ACTN|nr:MAG: hypothetical protein CVT63_03390 [Candidatus Anoxymicrobium japonicum]